MLLSTTRLLTPQMNVPQLILLFSRQTSPPTATDAISSLIDEFTNTLSIKEQIVDLLLKEKDEVLPRHRASFPVL